MSTAIRKHSQVSLAQAVDFCLAMEGEVTPHLVGQKGIGKTSAIEKAVPDKYTCAFFDCTSLTLEDIGIMDLNREEKFAEYLCNIACRFLGALVNSSNTMNSGLSR